MLNREELYLLSSLVASVRESYQRQDAIRCVSTGKYKGPGWGDGRVVEVDLSLADQLRLNELSKKLRKAANEHSVQCAM